MRIERLLSDHRRVMLGITGPPGVGKSTLGAEIVESFGAVGVPMDGFHLADSELKRLGRLGRKGAIDTFDGHGYASLLERIRAGKHIVYAPAFDRGIEQPIAGSIPIRPIARLVVTEGNYLLDGEEPWPSIRELLTEIWYLDIPGDERRRRLVARHIRFGKSPVQAEKWVTEVDEPNGDRIAHVKHKADLVLRL
jgi:pantothenate kinase